MQDIIMQDIIYLDALTVYIDILNDGKKRIKYIEIENKWRKGTLDLNAFRKLDDISIIGNGTTSIWAQYNPMLKKLVLPKGVEKVNTMSFYNSDIDEIVWPSSCYEVPPNCFSFSYLKKLSNVEHVRTIGRHAFGHSCLKSFRIPDGVKELPNSCFSNSTLEEIYGLEHIDRIPAEAFDTCKKLKHISGLGHITAIEKRAFFESGIEDLDLSCSVCRCIGDYAFAYSKLKTFKPSYYLQDVSPSAFNDTGISLSI